MNLVLRIAFWIAFSAYGVLLSPAQTQRQPQRSSDGLSGYISMTVPAPPDEYGYGVSLYSSAWPLLAQPLRGFQIGLASIWIIPDNRDFNEPLLPKGTVARDNWPERGPSYRDVFETIEGGLGFWASTRYGSVTAKFRMNGTANGYNQEVSSPGWGFGETRPLPPEQMGIAQLSNRLLVPPDGLTFDKGTCGELFGYAWMVLPLVKAKEQTAGLAIPTGNQCWTLFLNAKNFKGPVAFYTPATWSRVSRNYPPAVGRGLDTKRGLVAGGAIEVNTVPRMLSEDKHGAVFTKIPELQFPADNKGRTVLIHRLTHYSKEAVYRQVEAWMNGGPAASSRFDDHGARVAQVKAQPLSLRQGPDHSPIRGLDDWLGTTTVGTDTFALQWKPSALTPWTSTFQRARFPQYFKQEGKEFMAVASGAVPDESGLRQASFDPSNKGQVYSSPERGDSVWWRPGPKAGPYTAKLADGSEVTYYWYRFVDQPALQSADLSEADKDRLQAVVENIHRAWTIDKEYLPPPTMGTIAKLDPGLIVKPPRGMEVGYVPVVTRQTDAKS